MEKRQKILGINTGFEDLEYEGFDEYSILSNISLFDYDAIVIDSDLLSESYKEDITKVYQGKRLISKMDSPRIVDDFKRLGTQLIDFLNQGKTVFVLMGKNENCYIHTGKTEYSGSGKNARASDIVTEFDTYSFLPIKLNLNHVVGEKFTLCCSAPYLEFFKSTKNNNFYKVYFDSDNSKTLLKITDTEKSISAVCDYGKGKIVLLPYIYYSYDYENEEDWEKDGKNYLDALFALNERISSKLEDYALPKWTEDFCILNENKEKDELKKEYKKLKKIEEKIYEKEQKLIEIQSYKALVSATGEVLEDIVKKVLSEMGFVLECTEKGRSDIIAKFDEQPIVAEIKGVTKSAAEKHGAQLEKWVSQYFADTGIMPKSLLIVNGFCDIPLEKRTEDIFPHQMLQYCEARGHTLISTIQLLCLYIDIKTNPECLDDRISELLNHTGVYNRYTNLNDYLKK